MNDIKNALITQKIKKEKKGRKFNKFVKSRIFSKVKFNDLEAINR